MAWKLIYLNTPPNIIKKRWSANLKKKTRGHVKKITLVKALSMFEEPDKGEGTLNYNPNDDFEKWIEENNIFA